MARGCSLLLTLPPRERARHARQQHTPLTRLPVEPPPTSSTMLSTRSQLRAGVASAAPAKRSVIVQAKPTKAADFRGLDNAEILSKVAALKQECFRLEYMQRTRGNTVNPGAEANPEAVIPKPHEFKAARRQVAQLLTLLRQRELEAGVTRKQSRAMRKEAKVAAGFGRL